MNKQKGDMTVNDLMSGQKEHYEALNEIRQLKKTVELLSTKQRKYILDMPSVGNTIRFGVVADTHWGSSCERLDAFIAFMEMCEHTGIKKIYHAGDILDGHNVYKGQIFEQYARGLEEQKAVFEKKVPGFRGMDVYFITGNHDRSFKHLAGISVGEYIQKEKDNWHFLGEDSAKVTMRTKSGLPFSISLFHPSGGTAYAISYHLQKHIESLPGGQKPDCIFMGHDHKSYWMPEYRNVDGFGAGCFQSQTVFMAGKSSAAMVGGWIIEATIMPRSRLTRSLRAEFHSFFEPSVQKYR